MSNLKLIQQLINEQLGDAKSKNSHHRMDERYTKNDRDLDKLNRIHENVLNTNINNIDVAVERQAIAKVKKIEGVIKGIPGFISAIHSKPRINVHLDYIQGATINTKYYVHIWFSTEVDSGIVENALSSIDAQFFSNFVFGKNVMEFDGKTPSNAVGYISMMFKAD